MNKDERSAASTGADTERHRSDDLNPTSAPALSLPPQRLGSAMEGLHSAIMNLPCKVPSGYPFGSELCAGIYRQAHRDARHAAAELVSAALAEVEALRQRPGAQPWQYVVGPIMMAVTAYAKAYHAWHSSDDGEGGDGEMYTKSTAARKAVHDLVCAAVIGESQRPGAQAASEPVLPYDVKAGGTTFRKGVALSTFVNAARRWHEAAIPTPSPEDVAAFQQMLGEVRAITANVDEDTLASPAGERPAQAEPMTGVKEANPLYRDLREMAEAARLAKTARERPGAQAPSTADGVDEAAFLSRFEDNVNERNRLAAPSTAACDGGQCGAGGYCKDCPLAAPSTKGAETADALDAKRYRWLTKHAYVGECFTHNGTILEIHGTDRRVPMRGSVDAAIDAAIAALQSPAASPASKEDGRHE